METTNFLTISGDSFSGITTTTPGYGCSIYTPQSTKTALIEITSTLPNEEFNERIQKLLLKIGRKFNIKSYSVDYE